MAQLMAIINMTPDSYFPPSRVSYNNLENRIGELEKDGADIYDVGGESSRPGSESVPVEEELRRILPAVECISALSKKPISIDTMRPAIAEQAVQKGASYINDITGLQNRFMRDILHKYPHVQAILMHMKGEPRTMQFNTFYPEGVVDTIYGFFARQLDLLEKEGISRSRIILDPGIGFGKGLQENLDLIKNADRFKNLGCALLYGISRKSWIQHLLGKEVDDRLLPTIVASAFLINKEVDILRVHDVRAHADMIKTWQALS